MSYLIFDLAILVIVILFALWGRHRGLIRSVFSLVALIVAIIGGLFVSKALTPTVVTWVQPTVEKAVSQAWDSATGDVEDVLGGISGLFESTEPTAASPDGHSARITLLASAEENSTEKDILDSLPAGLLPEDFSLDDLKESLKEIDIELPDDLSLDLLPEDFSVDELKEQLKEADIELPEKVELVLSLLDDEALAVMAEGGSAKDMALNMAMNAAEVIVRAVLFLLAFVLILILWHILTRVLNLIAKLPVLRTFNKLGGFVFGILQGLLVVFLCVWVLRLLMAACVVTIPDNVIADSMLLEFFLNFKLMNTLPSF